MQPLRDCAVRNAWIMGLGPRDERYRCILGCDKCYLGVGGQDSMQHQGTCGGCRAPGVAQRMNIQRRMMSRQESSIQTLGRRGLQVVSARSRKVKVKKGAHAGVLAAAVSFGNHLYYKIHVLYL